MKYNFPIFLLIVFLVLASFLVGALHFSYPRNSLRECEIFIIFKYGRLKGQTDVLRDFAEHGKFGDLNRHWQSDSLELRKTLGL